MERQAPVRWVHPHYSARDRLKAMLLKSALPVAVEISNIPISETPPEKKRMKDTDDYLTARAANPRTGLISPSPEPSSPVIPVAMLRQRRYDTQPSSSNRPVRLTIDAADPVIRTFDPCGLKDDEFIVHMPSAREPQPYAYPGYTPEQIQALQSCRGTVCRTSCQHCHGEQLQDEALGPHHDQRPQRRASRRTLTRPQRRPPMSRPMPTPSSTRTPPAATQPQYANQARMPDHKNDNRISRPTRAPPVSPLPDRRAPNPEFRPRSARRSVPFSFLRKNPPATDRPRSASDDEPLKSLLGAATSVLEVSREAYKKVMTLMSSCCEGRLFAGWVPPSSTRNEEKGRGSAATVATVQGWWAILSRVAQTILVLVGLMVVWQVGAVVVRLLEVLLWPVVAPLRVIRACIDLCIAR